MDARWLKLYGPADLCPPGFDRSRSDELVAQYLQTAKPERAWFLCERSTGQVQRWHARSVSSSDFAVVRGKRGAVHGAQLCPCGECDESSEHVYLRCPIFAGIRQVLENKMDSWARRLRQTEAATGAWERASRADVLRWVHHNSPLVTNSSSAMQGREVRRAAFAFYSRMQQMRYAGGRFSYGQPERPMVVVDVGVSSSHQLAGVVVV